MLLVLVSLWTLLAAPRPAAAEDAPRILNASAEVAAHNALVVELRVRTDVPAGLVISYGNREVGTFRIVRPANGTTEQTVRIMRLRAESDYGLVVYAVAGDQWSTPWVRDVRTGQLPDVLKQWSFTTTGRPTFELSYSSFNSGGHTGIVVQDETGAIVWYYHLPGGNIIAGLRRLDSGDFLAMVQGVGLLRISEDARLLQIIEDRDGETYSHHDMEVLPDGRVLGLVDLPARVDLTSYGKGAAELIANPAIAEFHLESGRKTVLWQGLGPIDPMREMHLPGLLPIDGARIGPALDWLHTNSITQGPRGNYLVSSPFTDAVYSISSDFQRIEYRLGGPLSDFRFERPEDRFYFEHSAYELPNGNVLLFDNGGARWTSHQRPASEGGAYSRAIEYQLDRSTGIARKVWEYRHTSDASAPVVSSAVRLANGNTLVNFGVSPVLLVEVDPQQRPVWTLSYSAPATFAPPVNTGALTIRFVVRPLDTLNGEVRLAAGAR